MKINDRMLIFLNNDNVYKKSAPDKEHNYVASIINQPVNVDISAAGVDYYRKFCECNELNNNQATDIDPFEKPKHSIFDLKFTFFQQILGGTVEINSGKEIGDNANVTAHSFISSFANIYDEINKGYVDGTRVLWDITINDDGTVNERRITMEQELDALTEAADLAARFIANNIKANMLLQASFAKGHAQVDMQRTIHQNNRTKELESERMKQINEQLRVAEEFDADAFYERLMNGIRFIISNYSLGANLESLVNMVTR